MAADKFVYKIKSRTTGLYLTGKSPPRWTKIGKTWTRLQDVASHLRQQNDWKLYLDAELETYSVRKTGGPALGPLVRAAIEQEITRQESWLDEAAARRIQALRADIATLDAAEKP